MLSQELDFSDIYDLMAVRIIVNTLEECYHALGVVHDLWVPLRGFFGDYVAKPKPNNYQSLSYEQDQALGRADGDPDPHLGDAPHRGLRREPRTGATRRGPRKTS